MLRDKLVISGSLFPPDGDSDQIWGFFVVGFFFSFSSGSWGQNIAAMTAFLSVSEKADVLSERG